MREVIDLVVSKPVVDSFDAVPEVDALGVVPEVEGVIVDLECLELVLRVLLQLVVGRPGDPMSFWCVAQ